MVQLYQCVPACVVVSWDICDLLDGPYHPTFRGVCNALYLDVFVWGELLIDGLFHLPITDKSAVDIGVVDRLCEPTCVHLMVNRAVCERQGQDRCS